MFYTVHLSNASIHSKYQAITERLKPFWSMVGKLKLVYSHSETDEEVKIKALQDSEQHIKWNKERKGNTPKKHYLENNWELELKHSSS